MTIVKTILQLYCEYGQHGTNLKDIKNASLLLVTQKVKLIRIVDMYQY